MDQKRIDEVVELVGLKSRIKDSLKKYSLGMRQRIGLAQAIIHSPKLIILDEPTNGLDPAGIKELRDMLRKLAKNGTAVLVSSHLLTEMELMCDKVCIIDRGKLIGIRDLRKSRKVNNVEELFEYSYETTDNVKLEKLLKGKKYSVSSKDGEVQVMIEKDKIPALNREIIESGIDIFTVTQKTKSLEDIFMETTHSLGKEDRV